MDAKTRLEQIKASDTELYELSCRAVNRGLTGEPADPVDSDRAEELIHDLACDVSYLLSVIEHLEGVNMAVVDQHVANVMMTLKNQRDAASGACHSQVQRNKRLREKNAAHHRLTDELRAEVKSLRSVIEQQQREIERLITERMLASPNLRPATNELAKQSDVSAQVAASLQDAIRVYGMAAHDPTRAPER